VVSRIAVLWNPANPTTAPFLHATQAAAQSLGVELHVLEHTFRTLFRTSEAILEEPPVEGGSGSLYRRFHAL
jgi:hypothetical protein